MDYLICLYANIIWYLLCVHHGMGLPLWKVLGCRGRQPWALMTSWLSWVLAVSRAKGWWRIYQVCSGVGVDMHQGWGCRECLCCKSRFLHDHRWKCVLFASVFSYEFPWVSVCQCVACVCVCMDVCIRVCNMPICVTLDLYVCMYT